MNFSVIISMESLGVTYKQKHCALMYGILFGSGEVLEKAKVDWRCMFPHLRAIFNYAIVYC